MAQINAPKSLTSPRADDLREDGLQTAALGASAIFETYRTQIIAGLIGLAVLIAAFVAYRVWSGNQQDQAQLALGSILNVYTEGNFETALEGTDDAPGLIEISEQYGSTPTGQQATFFAADALFQLGRSDEAAAMFADYDGDGLLEASALAGRASIAEQKGEHAEAGALYAQAASAYVSPATSPGYLLDAGRAYAEAGDGDASVAALQQVADEYPDAPEALTAQTELGRVQAGQ